MKTYQRRHSITSQKKEMGRDGKGKEERGTDTSENEPSHLISTTSETEVRAKVLQKLTLEPSWFFYGNQKKKREETVIR